MSASNLRIWTKRMRNGAPVDVIEQNGCRVYVPTIEAWARQAYRLELRTRSAQAIAVLRDPLGRGDHAARRERP